MSEFPEKYIVFSKQQQQQIVRWTLTTIGSGSKMISIWMDFVEHPYWAVVTAKTKTMNILIWMIKTRQSLISKFGFCVCVHVLVTYL